MKRISTTYWAKTGDLQKDSTDSKLSLDETLDRSYDSGKLDDIFHTYLSKFLDQHPDIFDEWGLNPEEFNGLSIRKKEIVKLLSILLSDRQLFSKWFGTLPYMVTKVLETIVWEGKQEITELNRRTKENLLVSSTEQNGITLDDINIDFCLFLFKESKYSQTTGEKNYYLDLPVLVRKKLKNQLPIPQGYHLKPLKSPNNTEFIYEDNERILKTLPLVITFIRQDNLKLTKNGTPHKNSIVRLAEYCESAEFYPDAEKRDLRTLKTDLIVQMVLLNDFPSNMANPLELLKKLFEAFLTSDRFIGLSLLQHLKGWGSISCDSDKETHRNYFELLTQLPPNKWISIKQLLRFSLLREIDINPIEKEEAERSVFFTTEWNGWGNKRLYVTDQLFEKAISEPLIKAMFFLFSSFGLVDLKYNLPENESFLEEKQTWVSIYSGLKYVRLTTLGAFLCGQSRHYDSDSLSEEETEATLDDDRLIILLSKQDKLIELVLDKMAEKIGHNRYKVDFTSFLCDCSSERDIREKIQLFKETIPVALPENWQDFFQKILLRANPLKEQTDLTVYKIPRENKKLIDVITGDEVIRQYILKVEDYHIAIRKTDFEKVKSRLEYFGFLF